jgi:hypothetical protein
VRRTGPERGQIKTRHLRRGFVSRYFDLNFGAGMRNNNSRNSAASSSFGLAGGL